MTSRSGTWSAKRARWGTGARRRGAASRRGRRVRRGRGCRARESRRRLWRRVRAVEVEQLDGAADHASRRCGRPRPSARAGVDVGRPRRGADRDPWASRAPCLRRGVGAVLGQLDHLAMRPSSGRARATTVGAVEQAHRAVVGDEREGAFGVLGRHRVELVSKRDEGGLVRWSAGVTRSVAGSGSGKREQPRLLLGEDVGDGAVRVSFGCCRVVRDGVEEVARARRCRPRRE